MSKKTALLLIMGFIVALAHAHEFWLQPQKFRFKVGETATVRLLVGENFTGEPWDLTRHRVEKLLLHQASGVMDIRSLLKPHEKPPLQLSFKSNGTYLISMESNAAFTELDAEKFNTYLEEDGLDDVLSFRKKNDQLHKPAKEFYSRHSKLLLQVGGRLDDTYKKVVGLPIEIVPEVNPYELTMGDMLRFKILWEGKPLFGARVKVWNNKNNKIMVQDIYTQQDGTIETRLSNSGAWMVSVVKMVASKEEGADWRSYWGSLVFGIE